MNKRQRKTLLDHWNDTKDRETRRAIQYREAAQVFQDKGNATAADLFTELADNSERTAAYADTYIKGKTQS